MSLALASCNEKREQCKRLSSVIDLGQRTSERRHRLAGTQSTNDKINLIRDHLSEGEENSQKSGYLPGASLLLTLGDGSGALLDAVELKLDDSSFVALFLIGVDVGI